MVLDKARNVVSLVTHIGADIAYPAHVTRFAFEVVIRSFAIFLVCTRNALQSRIQIGYRQSLPLLFAVDHHQGLSELGVYACFETDFEIVHLLPIDLHL